MKTITCTLLTLLLMIPLTSHALSIGPVDGQVLDYDSGQPIEGAIVIGLWQGEYFQIVESKSACVHAESTVSDANGRYHIDGWAGPTFELGAHLQTNAYKAGFESTHGPLGYVGLEGKWVVFRTDGSREITQTFPDKESAIAATHPNDVYLKPFTGTPAQRLAYISRSIFSGMNCTQAGASRRNLYPLQKAAYQEAKPLATTRDDLNTLRRLKLIAESTWMALRPDEEYPENRHPEQVERDFQ
jgi:hypothetical protein